MQEEWRRVPGFALYEVSNLGNVRSRTLNFKPIKPQIKYQRGKPIALLLRPRIGKKRPIVIYLHRAILEAFVGPCPDGMEGCHNDGNCLNNRLDNLRWDTRKANVSDAIRHGTHRGVSEFLHLRDYSKTRFRRGENHHASVLTNEKVAKIRTLRTTGLSSRKISEIIVVSKSAVKNVLSGKTWAHLQ